ncbi:MAG: DUF488 domain-containing protein [Planctomycetota bacterium]
MPVRIVRLGTPRHPREGPRLGTVRRPPRGVPKSKHASGDWYDVWLPNLAPSAAVIKAYMTARTDAAWRKLSRTYRAEMGAPENRALLDVLASLSKTTNFSVGCYCEDEARCHRSLLRKLLVEHGAKVA